MAGKVQRVSGATFHDEVAPHSHEGEALPLGATAPCGCVVRAYRAVFVCCDRQQWFAGPTDVPLGQHVRLAMVCPECGKDATQWAPVYERPHYIRHPLEALGFPPPPQWRE